MTKSSKHFRKTETKSKIAEKINSAIQTTQPKSTNMIQWLFLAQLLFRILQINCIALCNTVQNVPDWGQVSI